MWICIFCPPLIFVFIRYREDDRTVLARDESRSPDKKKQRAQTARHRDQVELDSLSRIKNEDERARSGSKDKYYSNSIILCKCSINWGRGK